MDHLEIEVKFYMTDLDHIRNKLRDIGAHQTCGRTFEVNYRYDDKDQTLLKNRSILRLRKDRDTILTLKSRPLGQKDKDFKIHKEIEVKVSDFEKTDMIMEAIGFHRQQTYEKWRETFVLEKTEIVLDTLPYGNFLEIEGAREDIRKIADLLDLDWRKRILSSYLELFAQIKKKYALAFSDITFDNFTGIQVDITHLS
ncbi:MAG: class IV adenylate cyclase [Proteobacteria bacterium]|nr:class IV adenylate cyclase [Pseudomonadota bacterium]